MNRPDVEPIVAPIRVLTLLRDPGGAVLLVRPADGGRWQLPGGSPHPGEPLTLAAARKVKESTRLVCALTHVIALHQTPAGRDGSTAEGVTLVLDGGTVTAEAADAVRERPHCQWTPLHLLTLDAEPDEQHRIHAAIDATERGNELPLHHRPRGQAPGGG